MEFDLTKLSPNPDYKQAYGDYTKYLGKTKNPIDYYNDAVNSLGIPDARARVAADRKAISDTQALVDAVDPSVTGRTSGSLVTEAQRQGLVNKEKTPLLQSLGSLSGIYGTSSGNLADLMGQAQQQAGYGYQGDQANLSALYNRMQAAQYAEEQKRAAAAAAQQNAWITALQEQLAGIEGQINQANQGADDAGSTYDAGWAALNQPLSVSKNSGGLPGVTASPQNAYSFTPKTYNSQSAQKSTASPKIQGTGANKYSGKLSVTTGKKGAPLKVVDTARKWDITLPKHDPNKLRVVY